MSVYTRALRLPFSGQDWLVVSTAWWRLRQPGEVMVVDAASWHEAPPTALLPVYLTSRTTTTLLLPPLQPKAYLPRQELRAEEQYTCPRSPNLPFHCASWVWQLAPEHFWGTSLAWDAGQAWTRHWAEHSCHLPTFPLTLSRLTLVFPEPQHSKQARTWELTSAPELASLRSGAHNHRALFLKVWSILRQQLPSLGARPFYVTEWRSDGETLTLTLRARPPEWWPQTYA